MPVDTHGFKEQHIGKRLRIELASGAIEEIRLLELTVCAEPEPCCGITYRLISADHPGKSKEEGSVHWVGFGDIKSFQILGDATV